MPRDLPGWPIPGAARRRALTLLLTAAAVACCIACESAENSPPAKTYRVRGVVRQLAEPGAARAQIWVHHEAIPDFVGLDGEVEEMQVMTMPFTVAAAVDLSGLEVGSKIAFELTVDWSAADAALITAIEPLAPATALSFEAAE